MPPLTPTAHTVLGYLASHPRSGYDIGRAAARNPFWSLSDGQLYPQLRVLAERGLIATDGTTAPRSKTVWSITPSGREELLAWLRSESAPVSVRDENLAKLLFAARVDHGAARQLVLERRRHFEHFLSAVTAATPASTWNEQERTSAASVPALVREYGLEYSRTALRWCETVLEALDAADVTP